MSFTEDSEQKTPFLDRDGDAGVPNLSLPMHSSNSRTGGDADGVEGEALDDGGAFRTVRIAGGSALGWKEGDGWWWTKAGDNSVRGTDNEMVTAK